MGGRCPRMVVGVLDERTRGVFPWRISENWVHVSQWDGMPIFRTSATHPEVLRCAGRGERKDLFSNSEKGSHRAHGRFGANRSDQVIGQTRHQWRRRYFSRMLRIFRRKWKREGVRSCPIKANMPYLWGEGAQGGLPVSWEKGGKPPEVGHPIW